MAPRLACKGAAQDCSRVKSFLEHDVEALATLLMRGCGSFLVCLHQSPLAFLHFSIVFAQHGHCDNVHSRMFAHPDALLFCIFTAFEVASAKAVAPVACHSTGSCTIGTVHTGIEGKRVQQQDMEVRVNETSKIRLGDGTEFSPELCGSDKFSSFGFDDFDEHERSPLAADLSLEAAGHARTAGKRKRNSLEGSIELITPDVTASRLSSASTAAKLSMRSIRSSAFKAVPTVSTDQTSVRHAERPCRVKNKESREVNTSGASASQSVATEIEHTPAPDKAHTHTCEHCGRGFYKKSGGMLRHIAACKQTAGNCLDHQGRATLAQSSRLNAVGNTKVIRGSAFRGRQVEVKSAESASNTEAQDSILDLGVPKSSTETEAETQKLLDGQGSQARECFGAHAEEVVQQAVVRKVRRVSFRESPPKEVTLGEDPSRGEEWRKIQAQHASKKQQEGSVEAFTHTGIRFKDFESNACVSEDGTAPKKVVRLFDFGQQNRSSRDASQTCEQKSRQEASPNIRFNFGQPVFASTSNSDDEDSQLLYSESEKRAAGHPSIEELALSNRSRVHEEEEEVSPILTACSSPAKEEDFWLNQENETQDVAAAAPTQIQQDEDNKNVTVSPAGALVTEKEKEIQVKENMRADMNIEQQRFSWGWGGIAWGGMMNWNFGLKTPADGGSEDEAKGMPSETTKPQQDAGPGDKVAPAANVFDFGLKTPADGGSEDEAKVSFRIDSPEFAALEDTELVDWSPEIGIVESPQLSPCQQHRDLRFEFNAPKFHDFQNPALNVSPLPLPSSPAGEIGSSEVSVKKAVDPKLELNLGEEEIEQPLLDAFGRHLVLRLPPLGNSRRKRPREEGENRNMRLDQEFALCPPPVKKHDQGTFSALPPLLASEGSQKNSINSVAGASWQVSETVGERDLKQATVSAQESWPDSVLDQSDQSVPNECESSEDDSSSESCALSSESESSDADNDFVRKQSAEEESNDDNYLPDRDDWEKASLDSVSIAESDGEDELHVYLPPIDPDVLSGKKSVEQEHAELAGMLDKMKRDPTYLEWMKSKQLIHHER